jgi:hypothetical protein
MATHRLPTPGSDNGTWGDILNDFLVQAHNADGSLQDGIVTDAKISGSAAISKTKLAPGVQTSLTAADNATPKPASGVNGKPVQWNNTSGQLEDATTALNATYGPVEILVTGLVSNNGSGTVAAANTAAINAALTAASSNLGSGLGGVSGSGYGGIVVIPSGKYYWDGVISVPNSVDLIGASRVSTSLLAYSSTSSIQVGPLGGGPGTSSYGGVTGRFRLEGRSLATTLLHVGLAVSRHFEDISINNAAGDGLYLEQTQNCSFNLVDSQNNTGSGVVLDYGAGGNAFYKCEFSTNGYANGRTAASGTVTGPGYAIPTHNLFSHCIFEGAQASTVAGFLAAANGSLFFQSSIISLNPGYADLVGATNIPGLRVQKASGASTVEQVYVGEGCRIDGSKPAASSAYVGYGIEVDTAPADSVANVYIAAGVQISKCDTAIKTNSTARVDVEGRLYIVNCTNRFGTTDAGSQTEGTIVRTRTGAGDLTADDPAAPAITLRANASQTANVLELRNTAGTLVYNISQSGSHTAAATASANRMQVTNRGTSGTCAWSFGGVSSDNSTGIFSLGASDMSLAAGAAERVRLNSTGLSFNGATPAARPALPAAATDLASVITLTNAIRTALINYGLTT